MQRAAAAARGDRPANCAAERNQRPGDAQLIMTTLQWIETNKSYSYILVMYSFSL